MQLENVTLRPLLLSDRQDLARLINNKKIWDHLRDYIPYPYSETDAEFFINLSIADDPVQTFAIENNGRLAGVISILIQKDVYRKSAEIGYWIGEPFWGMGIATKAVRLITDYGFCQLNLVRVYAGIFEFNRASMRVLEKNGFEKEGIFRSAVIKNGNLSDEHRYAKINPSFSLIKNKMEPTSKTD